MHSLQGGQTAIKLRQCRHPRKPVIRVNAALIPTRTPANDHPLSSITVLVLGERLHDLSQGNSTSTQPANHYQFRLSTLLTSCYIAYVTGCLFPGLYSDLQVVGTSPLPLLCPRRAPVSTASDPELALPTCER